MTSATPATPPYSGQQETIFGVADGATYTGLLRLQDDGRYYFAQAQVDGHNLTLPEQHWASRDEAVKALAGMASGTLPAPTPQPASADR